MCHRAKLKRIISRDNSSVITTRYMPCMCMALYKQLKLALLGRSFGVLYLTLSGSSECAAWYKPSWSLQTTWSFCGRCVPGLPCPAKCSRVGGLILVSEVCITATHQSTHSGSTEGLWAQSLHTCQKVCMIIRVCVCVFRHIWVHTDLHIVMSIVQVCFALFESLGASIHICL